MLTAPKGAYLSEDAISLKRYPDTNPPSIRTSRHTSRRETTGAAVTSLLCASFGLLVLLPVVLDVFHDGAVFGIIAQLVPILVSLEPWIVVIPEFHGATQEADSQIALAEHGV